MPRLTLPPTNLGDGKKLFVTVIDDRPQKHLGYQINQTYEHAVLTPAEPVEEVVRKGLSDSFVKTGFEIVADPSAPVPTLEVRITGLQYTFDPSWSGFDSEVVASAQMRVLLGQREIYTKSYKGYETFKIVLRSPFLKDEMLNAVLADLLLMMIGDLDLLAALQSEPLRTFPPETAEKPAIPWSVSTTETP